MEEAAIRVRIIKKRGRSSQQLPASKRASEQARSAFKRICKRINYIIYQLTTSDTRVCFLR